LRGLFIDLTLTIYNYSFILSRTFFIIPAFFFKALTGKPFQGTHGVLRRLASKVSNAVETLRLAACKRRFAFSTPYAPIETFSPVDM
jgi:hypothetical protein